MLGWRFGFAVFGVMFVGACGSSSAPAEELPDADASDDTTVDVGAETIDSAMPMDSFAPMPDSAIDSAPDVADEGAPDTYVHDTYVADASCDEAGASVCALPTVHGTCTEAGVLSLMECSDESPACLEGACKPIWAYALELAGSGAGLAKNIVPIGAGQYVVVLQEQNGDVNQYGPLLLRIDENAVILDQKAFLPKMASPDDHAVLDWATASNVLGDVIVVGQYASPTKSESYFARIKASDMTVVSSTRMNVPAGSRGVSGVTITPAGVGNGYLIGGTAGIPSKPGQQVTWLARMDESLALTTNKTVRFSETLGGRAESAIMLVPGGAKPFAFGFTELPEGGTPVSYSERPTMLRLTSTLDVIAAESHIFEYDTGKGLYENFDRAIDVGDGIVVLGCASSAIAMKFSADSKTLWQARLTAPGKSCLLAGTRTPEGNVLAAGFRRNASDVSQAWLVELDGKTGAVVSDHVYDGLDDASLVDLALLPSGDVLLVGNATVTAEGTTHFSPVLARVPRSATPGPFVGTTSTATTTAPTSLAWAPGTSAVTVTSVAQPMVQKKWSVTRYRVYPK